MSHLKPGMNPRLGLLFLLVLGLVIGVLSIGEDIARAGPGNDLPTVTPIRLGEAVIGSVDPVGDSDRYTFSADAGDTILIRMSKASGSLYPALGIYAADGTQLAGNWGLQTTELFLTLAEGGEYTVLARDYYGENTGDYGLFVQRNNNPGNATLLGFGETVSASIGSVVDVDTYTFSANTGDVVLVKMSRTSGSFFPEIRLYAPSRALLARSWDTRATQISYPLPFTGGYTVLTSDYWGSRTGGYSISLERLSSGPLPALMPTPLSTPLSAPTRIPTPTPAPVATPTRTPTPLATATQMPTPTPTPTATPKPAPTPEPTPTPMPMPTPPPPPAGILFTESVPLPREVSTDPKVIGTNASFALAFVLLFYFAATLFNSTVKDNRETIQGWLRRASDRMRFMGNPLRERTSSLLRYGLKLPHYLKIPGSVAAFALLYSFLDPYFNSRLSGLALFISLALAIGIVTYSYEGVQVWVSTHRSRVPAMLKIYPIAIPVAIACVIFSRTIAFHPGLIYGFIVAYASLSAVSEEAKRPRAIMILAGMGITLLASGFAFLLRSYIPEVSGAESGFWLLLNEILVGVFVIGLEGMFFSLLPLAFMDGARVAAWNWLVWGGASTIVTFFFIHIIINEEGTLAEAARNKDVVMMVWVTAASLIVSLTIWVYFKGPRKSKELIAALATVRRTVWLYLQRRQMPLPEEGGEHRKLYAILWVDDAGALALRRSDVAWFHRHAGPFSIAWEQDDRYPWSSLEGLTRNGLDFSYDYLSHHPHPVAWRGNRLIKQVHDRLQIFGRFNQAMRFLTSLGLRTRKRRVLYLLVLLLALFLAVAVYQISPLYFTLLLVIYAIPSALLYIWFYVARQEGNWRITISDPEWLRGFLQKMELAFQQQGRAYPAVIRHGWNLPPEKSMEFYLQELRVLADASANFHPRERQQRFGERKIEWRLHQPYYADLGGDYNQPWDGGDEARRGLLVIPVSLGNISCYGFGDRERAFIAALPSGSPVSAYLHPWDDFLPVKRWVEYLQANYQVEFVTALEFAEGYMKKFPRPVLVSAEGEVYWAWVKGDQFLPLRQVKPDTIAVDTKDGHCRLTVNTEQAVPALWLSLNFETPPISPLRVTKQDRGTLLTAVKPGSYTLILK